MLDDTRPFPIQSDGFRRKPEPHEAKGCTIPWWLAEIAFERYDEKWGGQPLEQIARRGGFGRTELVKLIRREF